MRKKRNSETTSPRQGGRMGEVEVVVDLPASSAHCSTVSDRPQGFSFKVAGNFIRLDPQPHPKATPGPSELTWSPP